jgi:hypothetical protein
MMRRRPDLRVGSAALIAIPVAAIAAHAGAWYFTAHHWGLSSALASVLMVIVVVKHLGWISGACAILRRRRASRAMRP